MKRNLERIEAVGEAGREGLLRKVELQELCALDNMLEHMARGRRGERDRYERADQQEADEPFLVPMPKTHPCMIFLPLGPGGGERARHRGSLPRM